MSYKRTLQGSVSYSETVSVSYPASEHGGTTSRTVSGSIPVNITVYVDTDAFDSSISRCNGQIHGLQGSVVAMNSAQCQAIAESGRRISSSITHGFFSMIKSEISQNMAALLSKINSGLGLILEKVKLINHQQELMQSDYSRTKARYVKVFNELDEECRKRITELDKKAFELSASVQQNRLSQMQSDAAAFSVMGINDNNIAAVQLSTASIRNKTAVLMQTLGTDVENRLTYSKKLASVLHNQSNSAITPRCLPVLFIESDDMQDMNGKQTSCFVSAQTGDSSSKITDTVRNYFSSNPNIWMYNMGDASAPVKAHFNFLAEDMFLQDKSGNGEKAKRIYDMMMYLQNQSATLTNIKD